MRLESIILQRFRMSALIPSECRLQRRQVQGQICLMVDCPNMAIADHFWRNQHMLTAPLEDMALGDRCVILHQGRVWHPAFRDR